MATAVLLSLMASCQFRCGGAAGPMAASGPETWTIDGKTYQVAATYYLGLPEGLQYTIEIPWKFEKASPMNDDVALAIALPLMQHAFKNDRYKRMQFAKAGEGQVEANRIGVALVEQDGQRSHGYRVALSVPEIRSRIEAAKDQ